MADLPQYPIVPGSSPSLSPTPPTGQQMPTSTMLPYVLAMSLNTAAPVHISNNTTLNATSPQTQEPVNQYPQLLQSEPGAANNPLQGDEIGATGLQSATDLEKVNMNILTPSLSGGAGATGASGPSGPTGTTGSTGATGPVLEPWQETVTTFDEQGRPTRIDVYEPRTNQDVVRTIQEITTFDYSGINPTSVTVNSKGVKIRLTQYNQAGEPTQVRILGLDGETVISTQELTYNADDILTQTVSRDAMGRMTSRSTADEIGQIRQTDMFNPDTGQLQTRILYDELGNVTETIQY